MKILISGYSPPFSLQLETVLTQKGFTVYHADKGDSFDIAFYFDNSPKVNSSQHVYFVDSSFLSKGDTRVLVGEIKPEDAVKNIDKLLAEILGFGGKSNIVLGDTTVPVPVVAKVPTPIQQVSVYKNIPAPVINKDPRGTLKKVVPVSPITKKPASRISPVRYKKVGQYLPSAFVVLLFTLSFPVISLLVSVLLTLAAAKGSFAQPQLSSKFLGASLKMAHVTQSVLTPFATFPLTRPAYSYFYTIASLVKEGNSVALNGSLIANDSQKFIQEINNGSLSEANLYKDRISKSLPVFYKDASFFDAKLRSVLSLSKVIPEYELFTNSVALIARIQPFVESLHTILGFYESKSYMIVFQNNNELRPTGGFIGSFAIVTFERGRMVSKEVHDVYDADGRLTGFISPPLPISTYLGEASWHMRDANWDPDFPTTAKRLAWFLDKSMDRKVDGIIAIDLSILKMLLSAVGPLQVSGFATPLSSQNVGEILQTKIETQFFPGSRVKKDSLASILESLIIALDKAPLKSLFVLTTNISQLIEGRGLQVWFEDEGLTKATQKANLSGSLVSADCGANCQGVYQSIVEANVGVNKVNSYITRKVEATYLLEGDTLVGKINLVLTHNGGYSNNGNESYKSYVRLFAPVDVEFSNVKIAGDDTFESKEVEIKNRETLAEGGVLVLVPSNQSRTITFTTRQRMTQSKTHILWQKQAGVDPFSLSLTLPSGLVYNTTLEGLNSLTF